MVARLLIGQEETGPIAELLRPEFPDLVLEIALTSGGVNKLEVYRRFGVPEVWFWRSHKLEVFTLSREGQYRRTPKSHLLPGLDLALVESCVGISSWRQARQTFRTRLEG